MDDQKFNGKISIENNAFFVTSSGTDIGKTYLCSEIIRYARRQGHIIEALKPVISGFDAENPEDSDSALLLEAMGKELNIRNIKDISPLRYKEPLSPHMAAGIEGKEIIFEDVVGFCKKHIMESENTLLIEGVGGVLVPLNNQHTILDLIEELKLPVLMVVGSYLGSISHSLSALDVLYHRGIEISAIVISESLDSDVSLEKTRDTIARFSPYLESNVISLPRSAGVSHDSQVSAILDSMKIDNYDFAGNKSKTA